MTDYRDVLIATQARLIDAQTQTVVAYRGAFEKVMQENAALRKEADDLRKQMAMQQRGEGLQA